MKRILLASAAVVALAIAAPFAGAQYPDPVPATPPAYETQVPDDEAEAAVNDPMTPQTQLNPPPTVDPQPPAAQVQADTYGQTTVQDPQHADVHGQTTTQGAQPQTDAHGQVATEDAQTQADAYATTQDAQAAPYGQAASEAHLTTVDMAETAVMAGMDGVPMTPAEVCAPRSVSLANGTSRLNTSARRHLIVAADHASVCDVQRIVVHSPDGRAEAVRQTLVEHGMEEHLIEVDTAADGELGVEMTFNGVATSSAEYAAMFSPVQTAAFAPAGAAPSPYGTPDAGTMAPTESSDLNQPAVYQPADATAHPTGHAPAHPGEVFPEETPAEDESTSPIY